MAIYDNWCNAQHCPNYIAWSFGYGSCISCKLLGESGTVMFEDVDGGIRSEDSISTSQGIYPLLAAVRDELKAREGITI